MHIPALLHQEGESATIFVKGCDSQERQRLSIFHECGHFDLPWHGHHAGYLCDCGLSERVPDKRLEKEAFEYASRLLFPHEAFCTDIRSQTASLSTISHLAVRYQASFEATSIHYVTIHPGQCALLYLLRNPEKTRGAPFIVRYSVKSNRFHRFWRPGEPIRLHDLLAEAFLKKEIQYGQIPANVFGSQKKHKYWAEVWPFGPDQLRVFLHVRDRQTTLL